MRSRDSNKIANLFEPGGSELVSDLVTSGALG